MSKTMTLKSIKNCDSSSDTMLSRDVIRTVRGQKKPSGQMIGSAINQARNNLLFLVLRVRLFLHVE